MSPENRSQKLRQFFQDLGFSLDNIVDQEDYTSTFYQSKISYIINHLQRYDKGNIPYIWSELIKKQLNELSNDFTIKDFFDKLAFLLRELRSINRSSALYKIYVGGKDMNDIEINNLIVFKLLYDQGNASEEDKIILLVKILNDIYIKNNSIFYSPIFIEQHIYEYIKDYKDKICGIYIGFCLSASHEDTINSQLFHIKYNENDQLIIKTDYAFKGDEVKSNIYIGTIDFSDDLIPDDNGTVKILSIMNGVNYPYNKKVFTGYSPKERRDLLLCFIVNFTPKPNDKEINVFRYLLFKLNSDFEVSSFKREAISFIDLQNFIAKPNNAFLKKYSYYCKSVPEILFTIYKEESDHEESDYQESENKLIQHLSQNLLQYFYNPKEDMMYFKYFRIKNFSHFIKTKDIIKISGPQTRFKDKIDKDMDKNYPENKKRK